MFPFGLLLTLQIYGDSQFMSNRKIPLYFAQHFLRIINYPSGKVFSAIDNVANPNIFVFSFSEHSISPF